MMALKSGKSGISLSQLVEGLGRVSPEQDCVPGGIQCDSRNLVPGDLFLAFAGVNSNGWDYLEDADSAGACAVFIDKAYRVKGKSDGLPLIGVDKLAENAGVIVDRFFGHPSSALKVTGVTGTNGKTSITHIIAAALNRLTGRGTGVIGTLGIGTGNDMTASRNTTPDVVTIHSTLARMRDSGVRDVVMEVSSHALSQHRVAGVEFRLGIFTNLSPEHLDYHGDMETYARAKRQLFSFASLQAAIVNSDDPYGKKLLGELQGKLETVAYGLDEQSVIANENGYVHGSIVIAAVGELQLYVKSTWGEGTIACGLTGRFNAGNLLACLAALCVSGIPFPDAIAALSQTQPIPGRMECFRRPGSPRVIVDYAHTPDALEKALQSLCEIEHGRLICVVGCGGDRDKSKRPLMGGIAESLSDEVIFTNDNPRNEDPLAIIEQMLTGTRERNRISVVPDRAMAINQATSNAGSNDIVLVAGKGHETTQETKGVKTPFSDRQLVRNLLEKKDD